MAALPWLAVSVRPDSPRPESNRTWHERDERGTAVAAWPLSPLLPRPAPLPRRCDGPKREDKSETEETVTVINPLYRANRAASSTYDPALQRCNDDAPLGSENRASEPSDRSSGPLDPDRVRGGVPSGGWTVTGVPTSDVAWRVSQERQRISVAVSASRGLSGLARRTPTVHRIPTQHTTRHTACPPCSGSGAGVGLLRVRPCTCFDVYVA